MSLLYSNLLIRGAEAEQEAPPFVNRLLLLFVT
jgi:hypothetical protein